MSEAVELEIELEGSHNWEMMRHACRGPAAKSAWGMARGGDGGIFLQSQRWFFNGASSKRSEEVNGQTESCELVPISGSALIIFLYMM